MNLFDLIYHNIPKDKKYILSVALAHDYDVLSSVARAVSINLIEAILVGDEKKILEIAKDHNLSLQNCRIIHEDDIYQ